MSLVSSKVSRWRTNVSRFKNEAFCLTHLTRFCLFLHTDLFGGSNSAPDKPFVPETPTFTPGTNPPAFPFPVDEYYNDDQYDFPSPSPPPPLQPILPVINPSPSPVTTPSPSPPPLPQDSPSPPRTKSPPPKQLSPPPPGPPIGTIFIPGNQSGGNTTIEDTAGAADQSVKGSSQTTTIIIAVSCSVGGIILVSVLLILLCYCRSKRKEVTDSAGQMESGSQTARSRLDVRQNPSRRTSHIQEPSSKSIKMRGKSSHFDPVALHAASSASNYDMLSKASTADVLKYGPKPRLHGPDKTEDRGPLADAAFEYSGIAAGESHRTIQSLNSTSEGSVSPQPRAKNSKQALSVTQTHDTEMMVAGALQLNQKHNSSTRRAAQKSSLDTYKIDFSSLVLGEVIGSGSFGKVYKASWNETRVAVKFIMPDRNALDNVELEAGETFVAIDEILHKEAVMLSSLRHPNIVQFMGICPSPPCIISELCQHGSLADLLKAVRGNTKLRPSWRSMLGMMIDAATGVLYLHARSPQILHCDLKSSNLLVDSHLRVKVCDFNLSKLVEESTELQLGTRNPRWLAPEILDGERNTVESDAYAFGIIMWELVSCQVPWSGESVHSIITLVRDGARPRIPNFWDVVDSQGKELAVFEDYRELMTKCWAQNPYDRPGFKAIIKSLKEMIPFVDDRVHPEASGLHGGQPELPNGTSEQALMSASSTAVNASF